MALIPGQGRSGRRCSKGRVSAASRALLGWDRGRVQHHRTDYCLAGDRVEGVLVLPPADRTHEALVI